MPRPTTSLRAQVFARDGGVCRQCGMDTEKVRREPMNRAAADYFMRHGFPSPQESWWEADHIKAVIDDGDHTLENHQTLCIQCHKTKNRVETGTRAAGRAVRPPDYACLKEARE